MIIKHKQQTTSKEFTWFTDFSNSLKVDGHKLFIKESKVIYGGKMYLIRRSSYDFGKHASRKFNVEFRIYLDPKSEGNLKLCILLADNKREWPTSNLPVEEVFGHSVQLVYGTLAVGSKEITVNCVEHYV